MKNILLLLLFFLFCVCFIKAINLPISLKGTTLHQGKFVNYHQPQQSSRRKGIICEITLSNKTIYATHCRVSPELFKNYGKTINIYTYKDFFNDRERIYKIAILKNNKEYTISEFPQTFIILEKAIMFILCAMLFKILFKIL